MLQDSVAPENAWQDLPEGGDVPGQVDPSFLDHEADEHLDALASIHHHAQLQHALGVEWRQGPVCTLVLHGHLRQFVHDDLGGADEGVELESHLSGPEKLPKQSFGVAQVLQDCSPGRAPLGNLPDVAVCLWVLDELG